MVAVKQKPEVGVGNHFLVLCKWTGTLGTQFLYCAPVVLQGIVYPYMNLLLAIIKFLLLFFITIAALQISAVYLLRILQPELITADLVSIMPSSTDRITYGCMAAVDPGAAHLMLINNSPKALAKHAAKYGVP